MVYHEKYVFQFVQLEIYFLEAKQKLPVCKFLRYFSTITTSKVWSRWLSCSFEGALFTCGSYDNAVFRSLAMGLQLLYSKIQPHVCTKFMVSVTLSQVLDTAACHFRPISGDTVFLSGATLACSWDYQSWIIRTPLIILSNFLENFTAD